MTSLLDLAIEDAKGRGPGIRCRLLMWWQTLDDDMQSQVIDLVHATNLPIISRVKVLQNAGCPVGQKQISRHLTNREPCSRCLEVKLQVT